MIQSRYRHANGYGGLVASDEGLSSAYRATSIHWRRPALAVVRRRQQAIDELLVGVRRAVVHKRLNLFERRLEAQQTDIRPRDQRALVRRRRELEVLLGELRQDEVIDLVDRPALRRRNVRCRMRGDRLERPPFAALLQRHAFVLRRRGRERRCAHARIDGAFGNPLGEVFENRVGELAARRHLDERVGIAQHLQQAAVGGPARRQHRTGRTALEQALFGVENQVALRRRHLRVVTGVTPLHQHRPDLGFEKLDVGRLRSQRRADRKRKNRSDNTMTDKHGLSCA